MGKSIGMRASGKAIKSAKAMFPDATKTSKLQDAAMTVGRLGGAVARRPKTAGALGVAGVAGTGYLATRKKEALTESEAFHLLTEAVMERISSNQANQHYSTLPAYFPAGGVNSEVINSNNPLIATYGLVAQQQAMNLRRSQPSQPSRARGR